MGKYLIEDALRIIHNLCIFVYMQILNKSTDLVNQLSAIETFQEVPTSALEWLIEHSEYREYEPGDVLFTPGPATEEMSIILSGRINVRFKQGNEWRDGLAMEAGAITGILPYSRMKENRAEGIIAEKTRGLSLHKQHFQALAAESQELMQALVAVMTSRVRSFTQFRTQNEKLMALGKLSAGLAHELNNPASAMVRSAAELYRKIHTTPDKFKAVITMKITPEQTDQVNDILFSKIKNMNSLKLTLMEREEKLDELLDWLEDEEVKDPEEIAETFVDFGMTDEDLDEIKSIIPDQAVGIILWWLESTLSLEKLVSEIQESADRIANLVKSVKTYSHMDRGSSMTSTDIDEGIRTTLTMLNHKIKYKRIKVIEKYEDSLPKVNAFVGSLNQVWTNLIDNAIDAMELDDQLTIRTYAESPYVCVEIKDTGSGISEEELSRIFDPFYTTKGVGQGTGMGLDIVNKILDQHKATKQVTSQLGKGTTFKICFLSAAQEAE